MAALAVARTEMLLPATFSVGFSDAVYDETEHSDRIATQVSKQHARTRIGAPDVVSLLARAVYHAECALKESYDVATLALSGSCGTRG